ncbi:MFS family permease [Kribbella sandramycini]|uniref:MFS family permease n=1 Tax=Kribbella sandramycini TaxID=60450 RepID=A0A841S7Y8_9ACTN|nr:MFS family permease [Kribbella sandramycini]
MEDFVLLYPLYQLLFRDHGLSTTQISTLFVIWAATGFLLEVPSGAWADTYSRRTLLILGSLLSAVGYATWIVLPGYAGFAAGFVLWGAASALTSGSYEAFVYDELAARGEAEDFPTVLARARSAAFVANLAATALAAPVFAIGGYVLAGALSTLAGLTRAAVAYTLHESPSAPAESGSGSRRAFTEYGEMLRSGLTEVVRSRRLRWAVGLVALLGGFLAFDEYFGLLAGDLGVPTTLIPLLVATTVAAQAIGSALAGSAYKLPAATFTTLLIGAGLLIAVGALSGSPWGFALIALGYGVLQLVIVVAEARLQDAIEGPARATVTSTASFFSGVFAIAVYVGFAVGAVWLPLATLVAGLTVPVVLTAFVVPAAMPAVKIASAASKPESKS